MVRIGIDATAVIHGERGVRRSTRNLVQHLLRLPGDDRWSLLYFDRRGNTRGRLVPSAHSSERVSRLPVRLLTPSWRLLRWPQVESWLGSVDLLYAPDLYFPPARRAPVLCTIHGVAYLAIPELCHPEHVRSLRKALAYARRHAQHFLAVSESTRQDLLHYTDLRPEQIHVVSHGVDPMFRRLDAASCRHRLQERFQLHRPFFLYVGVIARHKNIPGLLEAMAVAAPHLHGVDLVLAGPLDPLMGSAQDVVRRCGLADRVHFLGPVDPESDDLLALYNAARALVFPTFYEGWCAPPLEAMACGTAVLASDVPAVREVVADAGLLIPPSDTAAWAAAMIRATEDEAWRAGLVRKGDEHVRQHTWERAASRVRRVFAEILGGGGCPP